MGKETNGAAGDAQGCGGGRGHGDHGSSEEGEVVHDEGGVGGFWLSCWIDEEDGCGVKTGFDGEKMGFIY